MLTTIENQRKLALQMATFLAPYTASSSDVDTLSWNVGLPEKNEKFGYEYYTEIRVSKKLKLLCMLIYKSWFHEKSVLW